MELSPLEIFQNGVACQSKIVDANALLLKSVYIFSFYRSLVVINFLCNYYPFNFQWINTTTLKIINANTDFFHKCWRQFEYSKLPQSQIIIYCLRIMYTKCSKRHGTSLWYNPGKRNNSGHKFVYTVWSQLCKENYWKAIKKKSSNGCHYAVQCEII